MVGQQTRVDVFMSTESLTPLARDTCTPSSSRAGIGRYSERVYQPIESRSLPPAVGRAGISRLFGDTELKQAPTTPPGIRGKQMYAPWQGNDQKKKTQG